MMIHQRRALHDADVHPARKRIPQPELRAWTAFLVNRVVRPGEVAAEQRQRADPPQNRERDGIGDRRVQVGHLHVVDHRLQRIGDRVLVAVRVGREDRYAETVHRGHERGIVRHIVHVDDQIDPAQYPPQMIDRPNLVVRLAVDQTGARHPAIDRTAHADQRDTLALVRRQIGKVHDAPSWSPEPT